MNNIIITAHKRRPGLTWMLSSTSTKGQLGVKSLCPQWDHRLSFAADQLTFNTRPVSSPVPMTSRHIDASISYQLLNTSSKSSAISKVSSSSLSRTTERHCPHRFPVVLLLLGFSFWLGPKCGHSKRPGQCLTIHWLKNVQLVEVLWLRVQQALSLHWDPASRKTQVQGPSCSGSEHWKPRRQKHRR